MIPVGRQFYKMSGSGNDFVMVDARETAPGALERPEVIQALCAPGTGVGADGIVFLEPSRVADVRMRYINRDGSLAALCGNASLCTTRLAVELGAASAKSLTIESDSGVLKARFRDGIPEVDLQPVTGVQECFEAPLTAGERRIGYMLVGVPHLCILCDDVEAVDVVSRGRPLRRHPALAQGANVNFLSKGEGGQWLMRTYERGVEAETLACGTGSVASAILLTVWGEVGGDVEITTRSRRSLRIRLRREGEAWFPSLSGEARVVFVGNLAEEPSEVPIKR
jgi:diaminopimelate epimerase